MLRPASVVALAALLAAVALPVRDAAAQGCTRTPRAVAGADISDCIGTVGTTDYQLTGSASVSVPVNGAIVQYCWTTDYGTFVESGAATACLASTDVTLRAPNIPGRTLITVTLVVTDAAGCSGTDQLTLDLSTSPVIVQAAAAVPQICSGESLDLLASARSTFEVNGLVEYSWDLDVRIDSNLNGVLDDDAEAVVVGVSGRLAVASLVPVREGTYTARVTVSTPGDPCVATADVVFTVLPRPVVRLVVGPATQCPFEVGRFQAELAFGDRGSDLTWDFDVTLDTDGDGDPANDSEAAGGQAQHAWQEPGTYTVRVTAVAANTCLGYEERDIVIRPAPVPAFRTLGPSCGALAVTFADESEGTAPLTITWDYGDGSPVESGTMRTHVYSQAGAYTVSHVVTDDDGCMTSESRVIEVVPVAASIEGITLFDGQPGTGTAGNANGFADPGERVRLAADVRNTGASVATGLVVSLRSGEPDGMLIPTDAQAGVPVLAPGAAGMTLEPHLAADISDRAPCGGILPAVFTVAGPGSGGCATSLTVPLRIGAPGLAPHGAEFSVTNSPGRADAPDIAFGAGAHAVVMADRTSGTPRVRASRFASGGQRIGDDLILDDIAGAARAPQIAWSPDVAQFAAVWTSMETGGQAAVTTRLRRIDSGGRPLGASRRLDLHGYSGTADIAWAGDHWLAAWTDKILPDAAPQLVVQVITGDGLLLGSPVPVGAAGADGGVVRLAGNGSRVLVVHVTGGEARLFAVEGQNPPVAVSLGVLAGASGAPAVAAFGAGYLVALENAGSIDLVWLTSSGGITRTSTGTGIRPALAIGGQMGVVAWESSGEIVARVIGATGTAAGGVHVVSTGLDPAGQPALGASDDGLFLAAFASTGQAANTLLRAVVLAPSNPEGCAPAGVIGDIAPAPAGNGTVDVGDVVLALRVAVGLTPVTPDVLARGDVAPGERVGTEHRVTGDGVIDISDAVVLLQASTGLITLAP